MDVNEKEVISKGTGGCPVSSFATLAKIQKKQHLEYNNFSSHINLATIRKNPRLQHSASHYVISTQGSVRDTLQFTVYNNLPDRLVLKPCHITLSCSSKPIHSIELLMLKKKLTLAYVNGTITKK